MRVSVGNLLAIRGKPLQGPAPAGNTSSSAAPTAARRSRSRAGQPREARRACARGGGAPAALSRTAVSAHAPEAARADARKFSKFTSRRLSPVVTGVGDGDGGGGGGGGGGTRRSATAAPTTTATSCRTAWSSRSGPTRASPTPTATRCRTAGSTTAKDLNIKAVPYPGSGPSRTRSTRPTAARGCPSSNIDFDGDGLTTLEEYRAWRYTGSSFDLAKAGGLDLESPLGYSDGTKFSRAGETQRSPAWRGPTTACRLRRSPSRRRSTSTATGRGAMTSATRTRRALELP